MAVTTEVRSDVQLQEDVLAELKWEPRLKPNEIGVAVKDGVVTLTGTVELVIEEVCCRTGCPPRARREGGRERYRREAFHDV